MDGMTELLWYPVFEIFGAPVTVVEVVGFVTGALCVWLAGRQNPWNWPVGLIQVSAYLVLFFQAGLFADSVLQGIYVVLGLWGWWNWIRDREIPGVLPVTRTPGSQWALMIGAGISATALIWWVLISFTPSVVPVADSITTVLSLLATYAMARKYLQSWWLWIAADVIYIPLYAYKGLWLTGLLYFIFLGLCILGLMQWRRSLTETQAMGELVSR